MAFHCGARGMRTLNRWRTAENARKLSRSNHLRNGVRWSSVSQRPGSDHVLFPGAVNSKYTTTLEFERPSTKTAMPTYRILDQDGVVIDKSREPIDMSEDYAVRLYKEMVTVSVMDIIMFEAQRQGRLSFYMVSAGEEGITVGAASSLDPADVCFAQYREHGVFMHRGFTLDQFMNQLFANRKDTGSGRNMPVHYGSRELNVHTISSTLATQIPHASGAAYALKMQHRQNPSTPPRIACAFFGEGAASEGDFHAALNIAATRACPALFICRNNGYAISTPTLEQYRGDGIASRGVGYGIETIRVDGNDILAVREVVRQARKICLGGGESSEKGEMRPVLIEAMSYRVSHHSTSDDSFAYRAKVEVEDWKRRDNPITRFRKYMEGRGWWNEEKEKEFRSKARKDILAAFANAEKEKKPPLRKLWEDAYKELNSDQLREMQEMKEMVKRYPGEYDVDAHEEGIGGLDPKS